ncbi:short-chain dehydrogenase/reductase SDR [Klebsiella pneumoniae]|nr:short-chain dehydrogenase/reductase SDR [Klebsiella pneumoniae]VVL32194.1 short chain dehydrogenase [Klebsiella pneumoniae]
MKSDQHNTILIVGASRGLGHAMAATFLQHGWEVIGTVRDLSSHTPLHDLAKTHPLRLRLATLDIRDEAQLTALQATLPAAMKPSLPRCRRRFPPRASTYCSSMLAPPIVTRRRPLATSPPRSFTR